MIRPRAEEATRLLNGMLSAYGIDLFTVKADDVECYGERVRATVRLGGATLTLDAPHSELEAAAFHLNAARAFGPLR